MDRLDPEGASRVGVRSGVYVRKMDVIIPRDIEIRDMALPILVYKNYEMVFVVLNPALKGVWIMIERDQISSMDVICLLA